MDYEELYQRLGKPHSTWTVRDTQAWLDFIGLGALKQGFGTGAAIQASMPSTAASSQNSPSSNSLAICSSGRDWCSGSS